jgi:hypothetical protein
MVSTGQPVFAFYTGRRRMGVERKTMEKNKGHIDYFIEPIGGETNDRLFKDILKNREEDVCEGLLCADGVSRNLLRVSETELATCIINSRTSELTFHAFRQTEKGIERIYLVFKDEIDDALTGETSLREAKVTYEDVARLLSTMPLIPPPKKAPSTYGVAPFNAKKKKLPIRISER